MDVFLETLEKIQMATEAVQGFVMPESYSRLEEKNKMLISEIDDMRMFLSTMADEDEDEDISEIVERMDFLWESIKVIHGTIVLEKLIDQGKYLETIVIDNQTDKNNKQNHDRFLKLKEKIINGEKLPNNTYHILMGLG